MQRYIYLNSNYTKVPSPSELRLKLIRLDMRLYFLKLELGLRHKRNFNPSQPRIPGGNPDGGQWTRIDGWRETNPYNKVPETWSNKDPVVFNDHFERHKKDFGTISPKDYANKANEFYKKFQTEKLPALKYASGEIGVYDPKTNAFGIYKNGKTVTFYKPTSSTYFERQIAKELSQGGKIINPMPGPTGGSNTGAGGNRGGGTTGGGSNPGGSSPRGGGSTPRGGGGRGAGGFGGGFGGGNRVGPNRNKPPFIF